MKMKSGQGRAKRAFLGRRLAGRQAGCVPKTDATSWSATDGTGSTESYALNTYYTDIFIIYISENNRNQDCIRSTGHIQIDCITNLQTTCSPMCHIKTSNESVQSQSHCDRQRSYFRRLHCGDSAGNSNVESSTRPLQTPRRWYPPICLYSGRIVTCPGTWTRASEGRVRP
jgi:hypothetical protein